MSKYTATIGIEIHVELKTNSKVFSPSKNDYNSTANTNICEIDLGYPGVLPTLNKGVIMSALKACLGLNCNINKKMHFDRKNYFYPDLPKGYQITQARTPIGCDGYVLVDNKKIRIERIHIEEDTAKSLHANNKTYLNYNRAGVPLLETVTDPCIGSSKEAILYLEALRNIFLYLGVSDARADLGQIRVDVNVSLKKENDDKLGTRVEMKNINSFSTVKEAIEVEIKRQMDILESGGVIEQETRRYDEVNKTTVFMRGKSDAVDYKYYTEPNIPPIKLRKEFIDEIRSKMPILEYDRKNKYINEYGISNVDASTLTKDKKLSDYFESIISFGANPKDTSNVITGFLLGYLNKNYKFLLLE